MTIDPPAHVQAPAPATPTSRRRFLQLGTAGLLTGAASYGGLTSGRHLLTPPTPMPVRVRGDVEDTGRILVMIKLDGGLDFLDTIIPRGARYHDLRRGGAIADGDRLPLDHDFDFHPMLNGLQSQWATGDLAIVHGVGLADSSLSHFVDSDAWARGRIEVGDGTGWLGRALDGVSPDVEPLIGVSVGDLTPAMYGPGWNAVALPDDGALPWTASFVEDNPGVVAAYQELLGAGTGSDLSGRVKASQQLVREVADTVDAATDLERIAAAAELLEVDDDGGGLLSSRLSLVADLINGGLPTRAYHVNFGDFDTHADQSATLPGLLSELDRSITAFQSSLGDNKDRVVIATWTEFGRRPDWNGSGTDHGTAGTQFVIGSAVRGGHYGEPVSLDRFDRDDNFTPTTDIGSYLGALSEQVLGVEARRVLPVTGSPMQVLT